MRYFHTFEGARDYAETMAYRNTKDYYIAQASDYTFERWLVGTRLQYLRSTKTLPFKAYVSPEGITHYGSGHSR